MKRKYRIGISLGVVVVFWISMEIRYAARINPKGVRSVPEHVARFGVPEAVFEVRHEEAEYFEVTGFPRGLSPLFALPSAPPAYIYDGNGHFVTWCSDPGDSPEWYEKWPREPGKGLDVAAFLARFQD